MLQGLAFRPPSLHLPTVVRLRLAGQMLSQDVNLDVLRPHEPTRALRKPDLTDKFFALFKETAIKSVVEFLTVKRLQRELSMLSVWHTSDLRSGMNVHPVRYTRTGIIACGRFLPMVYRARSHPHVEVCCNMFRRSTINNLVLAPHPEVRRW